MSGRARGSPPRRPCRGIDGELVASGRLAVAVVQDLQLEDAQPNPGTDLELGVGHPDHARLHFDFVPPTSL